MPAQIAAFEDRDGRRLVTCETEKYNHELSDHLLVINEES